MALKVLYPNGQVEAVLTFIETSPGVYEPWDGSVTVSVTSSGSAIEDGVTDTIKASVIDFLTSSGAANPLSVILTNTSGELYNATGGGSGGAVTIADGADTAEGATDDAAVTGDNDGTISAKLRGLNEIQADVWDSINHKINVEDAASEASLSSIDGKITKCDTDNVTVSSSALPTGAATEATLSSLNSKVTAVNTGAVVISSALPAGNNNIGDVDVATIPGIVGTIADDATTPGNPVMTGGFAKSPDGTDPGNVSAENDVVRFITDLNRRQYVNTNHPNAHAYHENSSSALTDTTVASAPGSGLQIVVTNIRCSTGAATAWNMFFEEGSTTVIGPIYLEAVAGRGFCSGPIWKPVTANTALTVTTSAAIAHSIDVEYIIQKV
jgi:hypothetical protein